MPTTAFFAYPNSDRSVKDAIARSVELSEGAELVIKPWENMSILGFKLDDLIRDQINEVDFLIADITYSNHNVFYEIGYAMAVGKPVLLTVNTAIEHSVKRVQSLGLFDTTGWLAYENGDDLWVKLQEWNNICWKNLYEAKRNHTQPLFILDTFGKTDFRNQIFHAVEHSKVQKRIFDPDQNPRLTAANAISEISASAGVIIPIIASNIVDNRNHNLRAAFLLGLAHGYEIEALSIQYENQPIPIDYRDFITNSTYRYETERHVESYCSETLVRNQQREARERRNAPGVIGQISLGASFAENETQTLGHYFIRTAEFARALRAEGAVVVGRKGSGKSAVFQQVAEVIGRDREVCIVDLRPASHNLSEMREELLGVVKAGVFEHTIAAFWQYILYIEVLLKIREIVLPRSKNDYGLQERVRKIEEDFHLTESVVSGDFTSRLEAAVQMVIQEVMNLKDDADIREKLTNLMFEAPIPKLREAILSFEDQYSDIVLLIDDLDKGWPPRRVEEHDVITVRHLIEVLNRIHRDLGRREVLFRHIVFLRSDIYERLVEQTSDRGKYNVINVDWSDSEQLRHLLHQRVTSEVDKEMQDQAWLAINPTIDGEEAVSSMIEHSLRRPRFLIDLCERVLSFAINRGHEIVTGADLQDGIRQMSLYLVSDFGYELRDVAGTPEDIFYRFIGKPDLLTTGEIEALLNENELGLEVNEAIDLLLWYGFLGIVSGNRPTFIYDRAYDFRRLEAERPEKNTEILYAVNPAFIVGLNKD
ncbi:MAG: hypothetical protein H6882_06590 [Rhodobiaceae bacterium]|nr:hypothetical protein [Rhodobiaceae bacterium]